MRAKPEVVSATEVMRTRSGAPGATPTVNRALPPVSLSQVSESSSDPRAGRPGQLFLAGPPSGKRVDVFGQLREVRPPLLSPPGTGQDHDFVGPFGFAQGRRCPLAVGRELLEVDLGSLLDSRQLQV